MSNENVTSHVLNQPSTDGDAQPETASKPVRILKKRGRKGNNIATAFKEVPATPVDFEEYAAQHKVSTNVLRQIKRHDSFSETGKVFVRKNKETKKMMIWREAPAQS
jgi:hypothetical protein